MRAAQQEKPRQIRSAPSTRLKAEGCRVVWPGDSILSRCWSEGKREGQGVGLGD